MHLQQSMTQTAVKMTKTAQYQTFQQLSMTHLNSFSYMSVDIQLPTWLSFDQDYMLNTHKHTATSYICM